MEENQGTPATSYQWHQCQPCKRTALAFSTNIWDVAAPVNLLTTPWLLPGPDPLLSCSWIPEPQDLGCNKRFILQ